MLLLQPLGHLSIESTSVSAQAEIVDAMQNIVFTGGPRCLFVPSTVMMHPDQSQPSADLCGLIVLDKPRGITSMDAVAIVRRKAARAKTGHAGTLDPLATGVLLIAIGKATKSIDRFMQTTKRYQTTIDLTAFTTTDDLEGERTEIATATPPNEARVRDAIATFTGNIMQQPPAFSAMKIDGRRAYKMARAGQTVDIPARLVVVHSINVMRYEWPMVELEIHCDKGFYVRSLARDLGQLLQTGGHCASIRRTAVGPFEIAESKQIENLPAILAATDLIPLDEALQQVATGL